MLRLLLRTKRLIGRPRGLEHRISEPADRSPSIAVAMEQEVQVGECRGVLLRQRHETEAQVLVRAHAPRVAEESAERAEQDVGNELRIAMTKDAQTGDRAATCRLEHDDVLLPVLRYARENVS